MNKHTTPTTLICPGCGSTFPIMRKTNKQKKLFHRKWLYCPICQKKTNHIETKDLDLLLVNITNKEEQYRSEDEVKVLELIKRSE